jgi:hypothetical protein
MTVDHSLPGLTSSPDTKELYAALARAQAQFPSVERGGDNKFGRYRYMRYSDICEALRPALLAEGFPIPQTKLTRINGDWVAVAELHHAPSGQWVNTLCPIYMGFDKEGNPKIDMQSLGSAYTYAKKYTFLSLVGAWAEDDDDGQQSVPPPKSKASKPNVIGRGMEIEAKAREAISKAASPEAIQKTVELVRLRVSEGVCPTAVLVRIEEFASQFPGGV